MSESPATSATDIADELFDRYTLPKVALAVILAASFVGTWVTTTLGGHQGLGFAVVKWVYFVALGTLTGGLLWKHVFVRPADLGADAADYCAAMYGRFDRIAVGALVGLTIGGAAVLAAYGSALGQSPGVYGYGLVGAALIAATMRSIVGSRTVDDQFRSWTGLTALGLAVVLVAATAVADVATRGLEPVAAGVRVLHLLAFAVWLGGAVWNIFVAVPTGQNRPTVPVVRAAGEQLERFRWAVRIIIPTLFVTGLYQAAVGIGMRAAAYLGTSVGIAVLGKLGFIGLLLVIFKLCPMWRACSPIEGVCDLETLGKTRPSDSNTTERRTEGADDD